MDFKAFISHLEKRLNGRKLPGQEAQLTMAPVTRREELKRLPAANTPRQSAVLLLFYPDGTTTRLIFIKRPVDDTVHSGQIAFPGGQTEPGDRDVFDTALREANEEVNVDPSKVKVLGSLTKLHIPPSNFDVYPVLGYSAEKPRFAGNDEVDRILEVDLAEILDPKTKMMKTIRHRLGKLVEVPCYFIEDEIIWGATAMIVGELLALIGPLPNNFSNTSNR